MAFAQQAATGDSSHEAGLGQSTRRLAFATDNGTWMSVDVSPDGATVVFDLLGDLYTVPITGGEATRITDGPALDAQPRFSPDGKMLAFVSDRGGADGIWLADADGRRPRLFLAGKYRSPVWCPDGTCLVAVKRGGGVEGEVMLYTFDGGTGLNLGRGVSPAFGRDSRYVYYSDAPHAESWYTPSIFVYDRVAFRRSVAMSDAVRPLLTRKGKLLFARRSDKGSRIRIVDLESEAERQITDASPVLNTDDPAREALPGGAVTPDGKTLLAWYRGGLWLTDLTNGRQRALAFRASVQQELGTSARATVALARDSMRTLQEIRDARLSPDGRRVAFVALGKIWSQSLPNGTPARLTQDSVDEYSPTWSPDGRYLAYVTWSPTGGAIYRIATSGDATPERLSRANAYFDRLNYSLDGRRLMAVQGRVQDRLEAYAPAPQNGLHLIWLPAAGGGATVIAGVDLPISATFLGRPFTTRDTSRVFITRAPGGLISMRWDGSDRRTVVAAAAGDEGLDDITLSPDGTYLAAVGRGVVTQQRGPLPSDSGMALTIGSPSSPLGPGRQWPQAGAHSVGWLADGRTLFYAAGMSLYTYDVGRADSVARDSVLRIVRGDSVVASNVAPTRIDLALAIRRDIPAGTVVLRGARLITMRGREIVERGDIVVTGDRIVSVGPIGAVPPGARVIDLSGRTILPGYVDLWARPRPFTRIHAQPWEYLANLAFGVTSIRDPEGPSPDASSYDALVETGALLGPRCFPAPGPEGHAAGFDKSNAVLSWTLFQKGVAEYAQNLSFTPLADDFVQLVAGSAATYVPALLGNIAGPPAADFYWEQGDRHDDPKLSHFIPHAVLDQEARRRSRRMQPGAYRYRDYALDAARIAAGGGWIGVGTRGVLPGLGLHWEMWLLGSGGMPAHDVLRAATSVGAEALGAGQDLGSLEPGKLADLQILDRDPLQDLRNTMSLSYVMKNGRLYEAGTLKEVWPRQRALPDPWWLADDPILRSSTPSTEN